MHPDVEGVDFRLGFCRFVTMMVVVVVVMVVTVVIIMSGFLVGLLRVLKTGTFIMMVMMMMVVLVQMLIFVHFVGLFRVLKTGTLIVVVVMVIVVIMVVQVPPGECRQGHPQHHQEQSEGDVNPDIFRVRFLADGGDGASPPHLGVIHLTTPSGTGTKRQKYDSKLELPRWRAAGENIYTSRLITQGTPTESGRGWHRFQTKNDL